jgi:membrane-bound lytic murein transglycosylase D
LGVIAQRYGVSLSSLRSANRGVIRWKDRINIGQKLLIPKGSSTSAPIKIQVYTIRRGDTLDEIAKKFGTSVRSIMKLNKMRSSRIYPGDKLKVVAGNRSSARRVSMARPIRYKIRSGDTLSEIAARYSTSVASIKSLNSLRSSRIRAGQVLRVR